MPLEIEIKIKLASHDEARASLIQNGAKRIGRFIELNAFFDTPDQSLRRADRGLRLRTSRDLDTKTESYILAHKGPRLPGELKRREETELHVQSATAAAALLAALGFVQFLSYEKSRESWELGGCRVELDQMPYLGSFLEIEGPTAEAIAAVQRQLNLTGQPSIRTGYPSLLSDYLRQHNINETNVKLPQ